MLSAWSSKIEAKKQNVMKNRLSFDYLSAVVGAVVIINMCASQFYLINRMIRTIIAHKCHSILF